jgi:phospholipid/cholesterol/gamma-HCH transport system substrate-binding protein
MLVNVVRGTRSEHLKLVIAGLGYLVAMALLVSLSIAIYQKKFEPVTMVTVQADRAGLQLARFGDVRQHGVLVGQVRDISQDGKQAVIKIGLKPEMAKKIPDNISVEILPTTLFGQKYIQLVSPERPSGGFLSDGDVIPADRVSTNVELQQILANLFPLLRSIRPADLNTTLYALSTALSGRGEKLGATLSDLDDYLGTINPELPTVERDLSLLADVAQTYSLAAPDLVDLLKNATTTATTVTDRQQQLGGFLTDLTSLAQTSTRVLIRNEQGIVTEARLARPLTGLLDTYSPEFPCLLKGVDRYTARLNGIFQNSRVNQSMYLDAKQRRAYDDRDRPKYGEVGHGPWCLGLPYPKVPAGPLPLNDGTRLDEPGYTG